MKILLKGDSTSPGKAKGKIKLIISDEDTIKIEQGEIIVANSLTPIHSLAIIKSGGIILSRGNNLSHPSIIARELGIPCIVNVKNATMILKEGMEVLIDGTTGEIFSED